MTERKRAKEALKRSEKAALRLAQETGVIADIGRIISSSLDIEEGQEGVMTTAYAAGMEVAGRRKGVVVPITGSVTEQMIRTGAPVLFQPESIDEVQNRFPGLVRSFQAGLRSRLSVPLIARGEVIGSLTLWSKQAKAYGKRDIRLAQSVASQIAGAIANAQLFQERNRAAEALKESEERYRGIFENAIEGIFQSTSEGRFVTVNPALARIYGWEFPLEMVREVATVWSLYVDRGESVRHGRLLDEHGIVRGLEAEHWRKDGSKFWVSLDIREVKDSNGKMVHYEGLVQDNTERKKLEDQLRQAQKMEAVGTLAGGIAHDFNKTSSPRLSGSPRWCWTTFRTMHVYGRRWNGCLTRVLGGGTLSGKSSPSAGEVTRRRRGCTCPPSSRRPSQIPHTAETDASGQRALSDGGLKQNMTVTLSGYGLTVSCTL